jgi:arylsulfatase
MPENWSQLLGRNDIELYDIENDPPELYNLAQDPEAHRDVIMMLNLRLNNLIRKEVGEDKGEHFPGDPKMWTNEV